MDPRVNSYPPRASVVGPAGGVCQIDHLIVHRWGTFIVESKSAMEEVHVGPDGTGGDEWTRVYRGGKAGMASPIALGNPQIPHRLQG